ncbi:MAG TPA: hypothetical protein PKC10_03835, partial [Cyclobacteriaceae bacterium]|nr:hypothetical protein [Cyclobacteriaceae bacterium]
MNRLILLFFVSPLLSIAQPITGLNFREWYNPNAEVTLSIDVVRLSNQMVVDFSINSQQFPLEKYAIVWERRDTYTQRDGTSLTETPTVLSESEKQKKGSWVFSIPATSWLLVAKITNLESKTTWVHFKKIDTKYPVNGWLEHNGQKLN